MRGLFSLLIALEICSSAPSQEANVDARGIAFFESKIRPVLVQQCYSCHSQDAKKNKKLRGDLFLDSRAGLLQGGTSGAVVVPGKSKDSLLLHALRHDGETKMPPKGKLGDEVIGAFAQWIDMGMPDPRDGKEVAIQKGVDVEAGKKLWAFGPVVKPAPPPVKNSGWVRTDVDRFILAQQETKGLVPNGPTSREKLLRRATFDLIGLPPTPAEVDAFLADSAPDAYERLVDRLLASPHYGERWGRHWLDLVRFAESGGYEFDKDRPGAYHYRDFVIKALNQDMPFDQFIRLQIAGDHLVPGDFLAASATGFLVSGPYPGQITSKTQELIRYNHLDDMVATLGSSVLGLSIGCARCHDHKYDPLPQKDYYRLLACLGRTDSADLKIDPNPGPYLQAKAVFDKAHATFLEAQTKFEKEQIPGKLKKWLQIAREKHPGDWFLAEETQSGAAKIPAKGAKAAVHTVRARTYLKDITGIRLEVPAGKTWNGPLATADVTLKATPLGTKAKETVLKLRALAPLAGAAKDAPAVFEIEGTAGFDGGALLTVTVPLKAVDGVPRLASLRLRDR